MKSGRVMTPGVRAAVALGPHQTFRPAWLAMRLMPNIENSSYDGVSLL